MVAFTQYLLPDGKRRPTHISRDPMIEKMADDIVVAGYRFEIEVIQDGNTVSLTIADPREDIDVAIELVPNGPNVPATVDALIMKFHRRLTAKSA